MKKSLLLSITLLVIAGTILAACSGVTSPSLEGTWKLTSYGSPTNPTPADPNIDTTLTFGSDGKLNGNVGCNSFSGDYEVDGNTVTFGAITSTLMACAEPIMEQELAVSAALTDTATFKIDGNILTITSADGTTALTFERK